ncbi:putative bifunctional diguanylate cyclase/phosphodiesterase [Deinococcus enclensis]|uniref:Diguanylate cyclase (GGDEF)-like protein n=1 Tax=Deinococcus enclensis TaxID=1049582 RepID=A0ABT9MC18_9DEIO|nr:EAL domain-containing protein [Deinococcus enclensis]MDP9764112.1 diguanylate cyclase (GGDEF)-like protein [Deinococcus enclensis]
MTISPESPSTLRPARTGPGATGPWLPRVLATLMALGALLYAAWIAWPWGGPQDVTTYSNVLYLPAIYAGFALSAVALRRAERPLRDVLLPLTVGLGLHALGDTLWAYLEMFTALPPFPSVADVAYLLAYPFLGWALARATLDGLGPWRLRRLGLDTLIVVGAVSVYLWWAAVAQIVGSGGPLLVRLTGLAYPAADLVLLTLVVLAVLHGRRPERHLVWFMLGLAAMIGADLGFLVLNSLGTYHEGHPVDLVFTVAYSLLALGAWQYQVSGHAPGPAAPTRRGPGGLQDRLAARATRLAAALPYLAAVAAGILQLWVSAAHEFGAYGVHLGAVLILLLVVARQAVTIQDNAQLTRSLQAFTGELELSRQQLSHQVNHDSLTGLPNRRLFEAQLTQAIGEAALRQGRFALLFIDLDSFKAINDRCGQHAGDDLLRQVAARLQSALGAEDRLARQGGDEFMVLADLAGGRDPVRVAQDLLQALRPPMTVDGQAVRVTASIGVSLYPDHAREAGELRRCADLAMFQAKRSSARGYRLFQADEPDPDQALLTRLEGALARGDLSLHYQPLFDLTDHRVVAVEALMRWTDPELGRVPPDRFIPVLEASPLIGPVGLWALDQALTQLARWQTRGWRGRMAVNICLAQLADPGFSVAVQAALERHGLRGEQLELEITERAVLIDVRQVTEQLLHLREVGVRLALDDFGMGQGTLLYLLDFPAQVIKLDRRITQGAQDSPRERRVAEALTTFIHALNFEVIAEGVETPEQLDLMKTLGVHLVQGFYLARPGPAASVDGLLLPGVPEKARA